MKVAEQKRRESEQTCEDWQRKHQAEQERCKVLQDQAARLREEVRKLTEQRDSIGCGSNGNSSTTVLQARCSLATLQASSVSIGNGSFGSPDGIGANSDDIQSLRHELEVMTAAKHREEQRSKELSQRLCELESRLEDTLEATNQWVQDHLDRMSIAAVRYR